MLHESVHDEVVERLIKAYKQVRIGDPWDRKLIYWGNQLLLNISRPVLNIRILNIPLMCISNAITSGYFF